MDIDNGPHQVTSLLSPLPEDVQSLSSIVLWKESNSTVKILLVLSGCPSHLCMQLFFSFLLFSAKSKTNPFDILLYLVIEGMTALWMWCSLIFKNINQYYKYLKGYYFMCLMRAGMFWRLLKTPGHTRQCDVIPQTQNLLTFCWGQQTPGSLFLHRPCKCPTQYLCVTVDSVFHSADLSGKYQKWLIKLYKKKININ